jgi:hypothetical protein
MALHTGEAVVEPDGNYHGLVVNHASRILAAAHGGQVLCSATATELLRRNSSSALPAVAFSDLGVYRLRGLDEPERLFLVQCESMSSSAAGQDTRPPAAERVDSNSSGGAGSVPLQFTRFFGREKEIAEIERLVLAPDVRLITLRVRAARARRAWPLKPRAGCSTP